MLCYSQLCFVGWCELELFWWFSLLVVVNCFVGWLLVTCLAVTCRYLGLYAYLALYWVVQSYYFGFTSGVLVACMLVSFVCFGVVLDSRCFLFVCLRVGFICQLTLRDFLCVVFGVCWVSWLVVGVWGLDSCFLAVVC